LEDDPFSLILENRSIEDLKNRLKRFYVDGAVEAKAISSKGLEKIKTWDWSIKVKKFESFFEKILPK